MILVSNDTNTKEHELEAKTNARIESELQEKNIAINYE